MKKETVIRSPMFYTGDKYKLINEMKLYFPQNINKFIEPFVGGGSVFLNIEAKIFLENDIDANIMSLHSFLSSFTDINELEKKLFKEISNYNLSCSFIENSVPQDLRNQFKKTYFAKYNKTFFDKMKKDYNNGTKKDSVILYLLLIYGFNRMLRFNKEGKYNVPVGNVDYNKNVHDALENYITLVNKKNIVWSNEDFSLFLSSIEFENNDFVYLDPPYLITASEYNKLWNQEDDIKMLSLLDDFTKRKIKFAMSNVVSYKGKENTRLLEWAKKYNVYPIKSNYINYHDNSIKSFKEVLITNYESN
ncbi:MAG: Dam family site-specific DNA-(adenine-N6)-methyltransferase [Treponemataceae bacterium]|nr:Dam family site-specific DNA-(adenine-N6)-methyltransferase [Treponemataceae bacterium]